MDLTNVILSPLLMAVILFDLRSLKLPNLLSIMMAALFVVAVSWSLPLPEVAWRFAAAFIVLIIGMGLNAAGLLGGGDVKVLSALTLFIPTQGWLSFVFVLCIATIVGIAGLLIVRKLLRGRKVTWLGLVQSGRYPMGLSIGLAGLYQLVIAG